MTSKMRSLRESTSNSQRQKTAILPRPRKPNSTANLPNTLKHTLLPPLSINLRSANSQELSVSSFFSPLSSLSFLRTNEVSRTTSRTSSHLKVSNLQRGMCQSRMQTAFGDTREEERSTTTLRSSRISTSESSNLVVRYSRFLMLG